MTLMTTALEHPLVSNWTMCLKPAGKSSGEDSSPIRMSVRKKDFTPGSTDSDNLPLTTLVGKMHRKRAEEESITREEQWHRRGRPSELQQLKKRRPKKML